MTERQGLTTYLDLTLDHEKAVNELIDGYEAAAVPDDLIADRLDSAGYALALEEDVQSLKLLATKGTAAKDTVALTSDNAYAAVVDMRTAQSKAHVPLEGRWLIVSPETYGLLLQDDKFIRQGDLSQELIESGAIGMIAGYPVYESANLPDKVEMIAGHPNWCHRVQEWQVPVAIKDLSNTYIGASAVQGRKIYGLLISKPKTVIVKKTV